jgi:hypothetical protein
MAITNTRTVERIEVYQTETDPTLMVVYTHMFDDTSDDELPITSTRAKHLTRFIVTNGEDGEVTSEATDVTSEDQLVQDICAAVWN